MMLLPLLVMFVGGLVDSLSTWLVVQVLRLFTEANPATALVLGLPLAPVWLVLRELVVCLLVYHVYYRSSLAKVWSSIGRAAVVWVLAVLRWLPVIVNMAKLVLLLYC